ncbi:MAG: S41 family peptidase [Thermotogota bacterium]
MKKFLVVVLLLVTLISFSSKFTYKDKRADFKILINFMEDNYVYFDFIEGVTKESFEKISEEYFKEISEDMTDLEYYNLINNYMRWFRNGHTNLIHPSWYYELSNTFSSGSMNYFDYFSEEIFNEESLETYKYLESIIENKYLTGRKELDPNNVETKIIEKDKIAYLKINSIGYAHYLADEEKVVSFLKEVKDYENIIIDVRGNGGGAVKYWQDYIVSKLTKAYLSVDYYIFNRSGKEAVDFINIHLPYVDTLMRADRSEVLSLPHTPEQLLTVDYMAPMKFKTGVSPEDSLNYEGNIFLLVDNGVYSSTEAFASFAKNTNFATLVGEKTGGDGIGLNPIFFKLPNTNLVLRTPSILGLNPDGTVNLIAGTEPDIKVDSEKALEKTIELINTDYKAREPRYENKIFSNILSYMPKEGNSESVLKDGLDYDKFNGKTIDKVEYKGYSKTNLNYLKWLIDLKEGEVYKATKIKNIETRLKNLNSFSEILLIPEYKEEELIITVYVQEGESFFKSTSNILENILQDIFESRVSLHYYNTFGTMINLHGGYSFNKYFPTYIKAEIPTNIFFTKRNDLEGGYYTEYIPKDEKVSELKRNYIKTNQTTYLTEKITASVTNEFFFDSSTDKNELNIVPDNYYRLNLNFNSSDGIGILSSVNAMKVGFNYDYDNFYPYYGYANLAKLDFDFGLTVSNLFRNKYMDMDTPLELQDKYNFENHLKSYQGMDVAKGQIFDSVSISQNLYNIINLEVIFETGKLIDKKEDISAQDFDFVVGGAVGFYTPMGVFKIRYTQSLINQDYNLYFGF